MTRLRAGVLVPPCVRAPDIRVMKRRGGEDVLIVWGVRGRRGLQGGPRIWVRARSMRETCGGRVRLAGRGPIGIRSRGGG